MLHIVQDLKEQLTSEDLNVRKEALVKLNEADMSKEDATVVLEFAKAHLKEHGTLEEAVKLGFKCIKADPELRTRWIGIIIETIQLAKAEASKNRAALYKALHATVVPNEDTLWITSFGAAFKNEKDPECLEWIFRIIQIVPNLSLFPLLTVYFPITLRADASKGEHLKSILKTAFKRLSELDGGEVVFEFLVERMETGSNYAIQDALEYLREIVVDAYWKRIFMLASKALIDDRFDAREAVQQLLTHWIQFSPTYKPMMLEYLENEIKTCLALETSLLASRGVSDLIKVYGHFADMNGIIEYCLSNMTLHPEGSAINNNTKTALLAAMISTDSFKKAPLEDYCKSLVNEFVDEQKKVIYRLSVFEAYSRKYTLSREIVNYAMDLGSAFLHHSRDERGRQFVELILCSLIRCNSQMTVELSINNNTWNRELLQLLYQEECTGKAIAEHAMVHGDIELLSAVLEQYKGNKLDAPICGDFLKLHSSEIDGSVLCKVAYHVDRLDEYFDLRVLSWIVFYAAKEDIQNLSKDLVSSLLQYPHGVMSMCNKLDMLTEQGELATIQALILKGDDRGYTLFNNAMNAKMPDLDKVLNLDLDLLSKAHFEIHPAYQQKFLSNVNIQVSSENYQIWLAIFSAITDVNIIPQEHARSAAFCSLGSGQFMQERIAVLKKLQEAPTEEFLAAIDLTSLNMQTRIELIEYLGLVHMEDAGVKAKVKRIIERMLDDKKYLVRQAASKAILVFY